MAVIEAGEMVEVGMLNKFHAVEMIHPCCWDNKSNGCAHTEDDAAAVDVT